MPTIGLGVRQLGPLICTVSATPGPQSLNSFLAVYREQQSVGAWSVWRLVGGLGLHVNYFPVGKIFVRRTLDLDVDTGWTAQWTLSVLECIRFSFGNPFLENAHQAA